MLSPAKRSWRASVTPGSRPLYYDKDFGLLLEKTDLDFHSEWLMPRGSIG